MDMDEESQRSTSGLSASVCSKCDEDDDPEWLYEVLVNDESSGDERADIEYNSKPVSHYSPRTKRPPQDWYITSSAKYNSQVKATPSDDPTLNKAMNFFSEERELWSLALMMSSNHFVIGARGYMTTSEVSAFTKPHCIESKGSCRWRS